MTKAPKILSNLTIVTALFLVTTAHSHGVIDGGGGGTLPANPITVERARQIIERESLQSLRLYLNYLEYTLRLVPESSSSILIKFFANDKRPQDTLDDITIEIAEDKPCFTKYGQPVDGSVHAQSPNAICISAYSMAPKLFEEIAHAQIQALILHEVGHLHDLTEEECVELQRDAVYALQRAPRESDNWTRLIHIQDKFAQLLMQLKRLQENQSLEELDDRLMKIVSEFSALDDIDVKTYSAILPSVDRELHDFVRWQVHVLVWFVHHQKDVRENPDAKYWNDLLDKIFGDEKQVSLNDFYKKHIGLDPRYRSNAGILPIKRPFSIRDIQNLANDLLAVVRRNTSWAQASAILSSSILPPTVAPWDELSPWLAYKGDYQIESTLCEKNGKPIEIPRGLKLESVSIFAHDTNRPQIKKNFSNGFTTEGLYNGTGVTTDSSASSKVYQNDLGVHRMIRSGHKWALNNSSITARYYEELMSLLFDGGFGPSLLIERRADDEVTTCNYQVRMN